MNKRRMTGRTVQLALIGVTTLLIWWFSLQPVDTSLSQSNAVRGWLSSLLGEGAVGLFILQHIRKIAHFTEYFVLGGQWGLYRRLHAGRLGWLYGLPVAVTDELLQMFSAGRGPGLGDVLLDVAGYVCGFGLLTGVLWLLRRFRKK